MVGSKSPQVMAGIPKQCYDNVNIYGSRPKNIFPGAITVARY